MKLGECQSCKELWRAYAKAMAAHVSLLVQEELVVGGPEWTTVADALTAAASEHDRLRRAIVLHEAEVHQRACPLASPAVLGRKPDNRPAALRLSTDAGAGALTS